MLSKEFVLALLIGCMLQETWTRTVSITLNLNLDLPKHDKTVSKLSADMVHTCLKRTELDMGELTRLRMGLASKSAPLEMRTTEDDNMLTSAEETAAEEKENYVEYGNISPLVIREKYQEPIQCFAYCLYEQMGLIKDGVFMANDVQTKLYALMEREQVQLSECMDVTSDNKCEAAYKLHLCYNKLKILESQTRMKTLEEVDRATTNDETLKNENGEEEEAETADDADTVDDDAENEI